MFKHYSTEIKIIGLLLVLSLVFFWKVLLNPGQMIYPAYDLVNIIEPWKYFQYASFQNYGQFPFWNPYETSGTTFVGNILSSMYYPMNILYFLINPDYIFGYIFLLDVFLAGVFMYLLVKSLKLDDYSSLLSAIVYMFSGIFIGRINIGHTQILDIFALTPLIFLLFIRTLEKKSWLYAALTGAVFGFQILAGYLQFSVYTAYVLIAYFLLDLISKRDFKKIVLVGVVVAVAFLVSFVQLLPSFELAKYSIHAGSAINYQFLTSPSTSYSLTPRYAISFILPDFFGNRLDRTYWASEQFEEVTTYIGILPLLLSVLAALYKRNKYTIFFTLLGLISLFFAFGQYNPAFPYLHKIILFFDIFRNPGRFLFLFTFSFAIVSGFGFNYLKHLIDKRDKRLFTLSKVISALAVIALVAFVAVYIYKNKIQSIGETQLANLLQQKYSSIGRVGNYVLDYYANNMSLIIDKIYWYIAGDMLKLFAILASTAMLLAFGTFRLGKYLPAMLLIIVILDLWVFGMKYIDVAPIGQLYPPNAVMNYISQDASNEEFRVIGLNMTLEQRFATRYGIQILDGFLPISLNDYAEYIAQMEGTPLSGANPLPAIQNLTNPQMLNLLNVKYILSTEKLDRNFILVSINNVTSFDIRKLLYFNETVYLYRNDNRLPRAFVVGNYTVLENNDEILSELSNSNFDPSGSVILEENPLAQNSTQGAWTTNITYYSPNEIKLHVNMSQSGFLVLSEIWYPDWKAFYSMCNNGVCSDQKTPAHIYKVDYTLRSIYMDKGEYNVEFVYDNSFINQLKAIL